MTKEQLENKLYERMSAENETFLTDLKAKPVDEIISIIRLSAKGTDGVMKRRCFRLKLMFAILFTGVLGILQRPWR